MSLFLHGVPVQLTNDSQSCFCRRLSCSVASTPNHLCRIELVRISRDWWRAHTRVDYRDHSLVSHLPQSRWSTLPSTTDGLHSPEDLIGTAVALTAAVRTLGGAIGTAFLSSILLSEGKKKVPTSIGTYAVKAGLPKAEVTPFVAAFYAESPKVAKIPGANAAVLEAAKLGEQFGYAEAFRLVFYTLLPFGILAAALCLSLPSVAKLMTDKVVAPARETSIRKAGDRRGTIKH